MLFFKKDECYMRCMHALLQVCLAEPLAELAGKAMPIVQGYGDFDRAAYAKFRSLMRSYFQGDLVDKAFLRAKRGKKLDDYQYYIPKFETYVARLSLFMVAGDEKKAKRMASFLAEFPSAYYRNDSGAMKDILYYEPLRFLE